MFFAGLTEGQKDKSSACKCVINRSRNSVGWVETMYVNYVRGGADMYVPVMHSIQICGRLSLRYVNQPVN
jgi:hypothetical protein